MVEKVTIYRKGDEKPLTALCDSVEKYESNITLKNPNLLNPDGESVNELIIYRENFLYVTIVEDYDKQLDDAGARSARRLTAD